ncbi:MAG: hypothetical protein ACI9TH_000814 [Kiritimatiellia bacterium]|jgi:hypothetical protein
MLFLNIGLALGLAAIAIPIIIHLLNRKSAKDIDWGAMRFLLESLATRSRRIQLEEALLMACRCLLFGLIALAVMRPFVPATSSIPWVVILPLLLLAVSAFGISFTMWNYPKWRWILLGSSVGVLLLCLLLVMVEKHLDLKRFGSRGQQDVALIIDGSTSMTLEVDGLSNFERAKQEARSIIENSHRGTAYSIILGGPSPQAQTDQPITSRPDLYQILDALEPTRGAMQAYDTLTLASLGLTQGFNANKQMVVISDGQQLGWETDNPSRWSFLSDAFDNLPSRPKVILRNLTLPAQFRNVSIAEVAFSRDVVGIDRPVTINVTVENTGTEAVTPSEIEVKVAGETLSDSTIGQLVPGASETVRFSYQFRKAGSHVVTANVKVTDELMQDNRYETAVNVLGSLKVLIVDGNPSDRFIERASAFTALALAPGSATASRVKSNIKHSQEFLVEPDVIAATEIKSIDNLFAYHTIILADVPRLPQQTAKELTTFVKKGGGLLIAPGRRALPEFYDQWLSEDTTPLVPARLSSQVAIQRADDDIKPVPSTFNHHALRLIADAEKSDIGTTSLYAYWKLQAEEGVDDRVTIGGYLNNGDPFVVSRKYGSGNVMLLACSLDISGSSLATRQCFVPLVHELVYYLSNPTGMQLNLEPGWELALKLGSGETGDVKGGRNGLQVEVFNKTRCRDLLYSDVDKKIEFHLSYRHPKVTSRSYSVRWTGSLMPRYSEEYEFSVDTSGSFNLWVDNQPVIKRRGKGTILLNANQLYDFRAEADLQGNGPYSKLHWKSRSQGFELVPESQLLVQRGSLAGLEKTMDLQAVDPSGNRREAALYRGPEGLLAKVKGKVETGLYMLLIPEKNRRDFDTMLDRDGGIPFTVKSDTRESRLATLVPDDTDFMKRYVDLLLPESAEQVSGILQGKSFGEELWKYLALAALALLLGEIALSRWIAIQRRTGIEETVDFEGMMQPGKGFQEALGKMRGHG